MNRQTEEVDRSRAERGERDKKEEEDKNAGVDGVGWGG